MFLVIWNMISQSAMFFSWKFLADDFWLCIFASRCSSKPLPPWPARAGPLPEHSEALCLSAIHPCRLAPRSECSRTAALSGWPPTAAAPARRVPMVGSSRRAGGSGRPAGAGPPPSRRRWRWVCVLWVQLARGGDACAWRDVFSTWRAAGWRGRVALGHAGTQWLRNWSPRFVYPLYISQTWKLKKVKFMRKI